MGINKRMKKEEFCIMPDNPPYWRNKRYLGTHRHEAFFGVRNRQKSIDDGLVVFLTYEMHEGTYGVHGKKGHKFDLTVKKEAEKRWCEYYGKTKEDFRNRYGRNYL